MEPRLVEGESGDWVAMIYRSAGQIVARLALMVVAALVFVSL